MKKVLKMVAILVLFQSFQCEEDVVERDQATELAQLQNEKQVILEYVASIPCEATIGCDYMALGSKPCGGPWEYLVYSNAVDIAYLTDLVTTYNSHEAEYNETYDIYSDCAVVNPPQNVGCIDGVCVVIP